MKKVVFISALLIGLMCTLSIKVKADAPTDYTYIGYFGDSPWKYEYAIKNTAFYNETVTNIIYNNVEYAFIKPVAIWENDTISIYAFSLDGKGVACAPATGGLFVSFNNSFTQGGCTSVSGFDGIPIFNNPTDAFAYSQGFTFDSSNVVGGSMPFSMPSIGEEYYENKIYNFQKVWNVYSRPNTRMSWNIAWIQNYDNDLYESSDYHRQIGITVKYPDYTSISNLYDSVFNEPQSFFTSLEYAKSFFTYDNMYDSRLTYKETTIWVDIDDLINDVEANGENSEYYNWYKLTENTDKSEYNFTMYETTETFLTASNFGQTYSYNPKGMINIFRQYYNNDRLLLFALPFCVFDKAQMFTFNQPLNIVYNPVYIFWFDATAPDGTRSEKRNFGNPTNITSDNLVEPLDSNGNTGVPNGVPKPTEQQLASNYNSSIQDSYNNIYNNYYYTSSQNQDLLDYLMKYKDGGTEQDVQDAFGYVNSTIDSVSNVPIMLGKLFTGFFPPKVIMLFSALFIIFAVFIIVKIIRHLFL